MPQSTEAHLTHHNLLIVRCDDKVVCPLWCHSRAESGSSSKLVAWYGGWGKLSLSPDGSSFLQLLRAPPTNAFPFPTSSTFNRAPVCFAPICFTGGCRQRANWGFFPDSLHKFLFLWSRMAAQLEFGFLGEKGGKEECWRANRWCIGGVSYSAARLTLVLCRRGIDREYVKAVQLWLKENTSILGIHLVGVEKISFGVAFSRFSLNVLLDYWTVDSSRV